MSERTHPSAANILPKIAIIAIAIVFASMFLHGYAFNSARSEFTSTQAQYILTHISVILFLQAAFLVIVCFGITKLKLRPSIAAVLIALLIATTLTANSFSLLFFHMDSLSEKPLYIKLAVAAISFFVTFSLANAMLDHKQVRWGAIALSSILFLAVSLGFGASAPLNPPDRAQANGKLGEAAKNSRNIYFISFDSMVPRSLAKKFIEVSDVPYMDVLEQNGARIFNNGFASFVPTKPAMNSMLTLDPKLFLGMKSRQRYQFFPGLAESTVSRVMHQRGYRVQTMYGSPYFGATPGTYNDYYMIASRQTSTCDHVSNKHVFLGYCQKAIASLSVPVIAILKPGANEINAEYPKFLFDRIKQTSSYGERWFTMAHIYSPGHTAKDFRYDNPKAVEDYRTFFVEQSIVAAGHLKELIDILRQNDPEAILMIYGDHGTYMSRGVATESKTGFPIDAAQQEFYVHDRHGINIAVLPGDICTDEFAPIEKNNYAINTQVARAVIKCATKGSDPLKTEPEFRLPLEKVPFEERPKFTEYIYE